MHNNTDITDLLKPGDYTIATVPKGVLLTRDIIEDLLSEYHRLGRQLTEPETLAVIKNKKGAPFRMRP